jgi:hypothetical protein
MSQPALPQPDSAAPSPVRSGLPATPHEAASRRGEAPVLPVASLVAVPVRKSRPLAAAPVVASPPAAAPARIGARTVAAVPLDPRQVSSAPELAFPPRVPDAVPAEGDPAKLIAWWNGLKRGGAYPSPTDLDAKAISAVWPEAVLLAYDKARQDIARASRLGTVDNLSIEYTPMVTEWLLALGRRAAREGAPLHETRDFTGARGLTSYQLTALPLSADRHSADHVLCRLARA